MSSKESDPDIQDLYVCIVAPAHYLQPLFMLTNTWQLVEGFMETMIWGLAGVTEAKGRSITAHMTFPLRCDVLAALYHSHFKDVRPTNS